MAARSPAAAPFLLSQKAVSVPTRLPINVFTHNYWLTFSWIIFRHSHPLPQISQGLDESVADSA